MASIRQLYVTLSLKADDYNNKIRAAQKEMKEFEKTIAPSVKALKDIGTGATAAGTAMTAGLTAPIVGFAALAVSNFSQAAEAVGLMENALRSTGGVSGKTAEELKKTAASLQAISLFDDDEILRKVTTNLLTFTNVSGQSFDRAQQAALNLSTVLGQDLQSSAIQLGKALQDPVAGASALQRVGVRLSDEQKELIKSFVAAGETAKAQGVILDELEKQFGGAAEAVAKLGTGPLVQLKNQFGDLTEKFGEIILSGITPLVGWISDLLDWFNSFSDSTKTVMVVIGLLVAAIGPLLLAFGFIATSIAGLVPVFTGIAAVISAVGVPMLALIAGPIALLIAAVASIGVAFAIFPELRQIASTAFSAISDAVSSLWASMVDFWNKQTELKAALSDAWMEIKAALGDAMTQIVALFKEGAAVALAIWQEWGPSVKAVFQFVVDSLTASVQIFTDVLTTGLKFITGVIQTFHGLITGDFDTFKGGLVRIWEATWEAIKGAANLALNIVKAAINSWHTVLSLAFSAFKSAVEAIWTALWNAIKNAVTAPLNAVKDTVSGFTAAVINKFKDMYDAVVGNSYVPDMIEGIKGAFGTLGTVMVAPAVVAIDSVTSGFRSMKDMVGGSIKEMFSDISAKLAGMIVDWDFSFKGILDIVKNTAKDMLASFIEGFFQPLTSKLAGFGGELASGLFGSMSNAQRGQQGAGGAGGGGFDIGSYFNTAISSFGTGNRLQAGIGGFMLGGPIGAALGAAFGAGRQAHDAADDIVKSQEAFTEAIVGILENPALTGTSKLNLVNDAWDEFQANIRSFAGNDLNNQIVMNQAFATLQPWISQIRQDLEPWVQKEKEAANALADASREGVTFPEEALSAFRRFAESVHMFKEAVEKFAASAIRTIASVADTAQTAVSTAVNTLAASVTDAASSQPAVQNTSGVVGDILGRVMSTGDHLASLDAGIAEASGNWLAQSRMSNQGMMTPGFSGEVAPVAQAPIVQVHVEYTTPVEVRMANDPRSVRDAVIDGAQTNQGGFLDELTGAIKAALPSVTIAPA